MRSAIRTADDDRPAGPRVMSVVAGSAADAAGILADDVIVKFDGTAIDNAADLVVAVQLRQPGRPGPGLGRDATATRSA